MKYYKPLPSNLTIKNSSIEGLGIFATENIPIGIDLGPTHLINNDFEDGVVRLPLGGFFNHSEDSNCKIIEGYYSDTLKHKCLRLLTIKNIQIGEEITAKYTLYNPSKKNMGIAAMASFTNQNNKLVETKENLLHVKYLVSPEFFHTYFQTIELN